MVRHISESLNHCPIEMHQPCLAALVRVWVQLLEIGDKLAELDRIGGVAASHRQNDDVRLHIGLISGSFKPDKIEKPDFPQCVEYSGIPALDPGYERTNSEP